MIGRRARLRSHGSLPRTQQHQEPRPTDEWRVEWVVNCTFIGHILPTVYKGINVGDLAVHVLRCGHNGHLPPARLISGIVVSAEAALAIESRRVPSAGTPGRTRTDTGGPFRGPASSLGLRGRIHNTARAIA